jgi:hypothetical protein
MNHKFLAKPSPDDERDYRVARVAPTLSVFPDEFRIPFNGEIKNQGEIGSCVAQSLAYTREIQEEKQSGVYKKFSTAFIYGNRQASDFQGEGMYPREALNGLKRYGDVLYEKFPGNITYPETREKLGPILEDLLSDAMPYRITTYFRIYNIDELKSTLMNVGPVSGCFPIWKSIYKVTQENPIIPLPPKQGEKSLEFLGYHEMTIMGWTADDKLIILNSWGEEWAEGGYAYLPLAYPIAEMWGITDSIEPKQDLENPKFYSLLVRKIFSIKQTAIMFMESLRKRGFNNAFVIENKETGRFEVQVGFYSDPRDRGLTELRNNLNKINCPTQLVYR